MTSFSQFHFLTFSLWKRYNKKRKGAAAVNELSRRIYNYIKEALAYEGSPSVRDICRDLDIKSTSTVHRYLNELEEDGLISRKNRDRKSVV